MTEFTELLAGIRHEGDAWIVTISNDWLQGRTVYGGLGAALCLEATLRAIPDLPPLRSAQFSFIGPATGQLRMQPALLRRGKSTVFAGVDLTGEDGLATRAILCFGAARSSPLAINTIGEQRPAVPDQCPPFFAGAPPYLYFLQHIDGKSAGKHLPFSGASEPDMTVWLRHRDPKLQPSLVSLLALADAPPPGILAMVDRPGAISTMTWSIDMLTDTLETDNGWWLVRTRADAAADSYTSQTMTVWNASGKPIMASRQNVAMFF
jgi:acyl-CoA thioesterase